MRYVRVLNVQRRSVLGARVGLAESWWSRLRGFLGRPAPRPGEGLLLTPCRGVHMYGMKFPLDVIVLDGSGHVTGCYPGLVPGARTPLHREADSVIELPVGTIAATGTAVGDRVVWQPVVPGAEPQPPAPISNEPAHWASTERRRSV